MRAEQEEPKLVSTQATVLEAEDEELGIYEDTGAGPDLYEGRHNKVPKPVKIPTGISSTVIPASAPAKPILVPDNNPALNVFSFHLKSQNQVRVKTTPQIRIISPPNSPIFLRRQSEPYQMDKKADKEMEYAQRRFIGTNTRVNTPCYDVRESPLLSGSGTMTGLFKHVLLYQNRPTPMSPLKAWQGYNGNIYFDPIKINRVNSANATEGQASKLAEQKAELEGAKRRNQIAKTDLTRFLHCDPPQRPNVYLDKQAVTSWKNKQQLDDLEYIMSTEDVGSLMMEQGYGDKAKTISSQNLCKGSVAHKVAVEKSANTNLHPRNKRSNSLPKPTPVMKVAGGKVTTPQISSNSLIKATTQYSQSANRPKTNSPAPDVAVPSQQVPFEKLPPLDQFRESLKHMKPLTGASRNSKPRIISERPPYVKFSRNYVVN